MDQAGGPLGLLCVRAGVQHQKTVVSGDVREDMCGSVTRCMVKRPGCGGFCKEANSPKPFSMRELKLDLRAQALGTLPVPSHAPLA